MTRDKPNSKALARLRYSGKDPSIKEEDIEYWKMLGLKYTVQKRYCKFCGNLLDGSHHYYFWCDHCMRHISKGVYL